LRFSKRIKFPWPVLVVLGLLYTWWAARFIALSSVQTGEGRYFCLFDDAMVSLRYAWNLAHGQGLVWNVGERVEGFTNFLTVIYMSLGALFLGKSQAVLFVQISGVLLVLATALLAFRVARLLDTSGYLGFVTATAVLAYYPLSYWSLMGMETGLLTLLSLAALRLAMRLESIERGSAWLGLLLGLMFVTRPDAAVPAALILGFRLAWILIHHRRLGALKPWLVEPATFAAVLGGLTLFRLLYYGTPVPNTYLLKIGGWPLASRLQNGWHFVKPFFVSSRYLVVLAVCSLATRPDRSRLLLLSFAACVVGCQIWAGGDAWFYWRILTPAVVVMIVLAVDGGARIVRWFVRPARRWTIATLSAAVPLSAVWIADRPFAGELTLKTRPYLVSFNENNVPAGLQLARWVDQGGTVAIGAAGAVPYYSGLRAIDLLGKSDRHIAQLAPDLTFGFEGQDITPGHNKYDLHYSLEKRKPDALDLAQWGHDDVREFVFREYVHYGAWWLRRDSRHVRWQLLPPPSR
jgi:hypothetical protein